MRLSEVHSFDQTSGLNVEKERYLKSVVYLKIRKFNMLNKDKPFKCLKAEEG